MFVPVSKRLVVLDWPVQPVAAPGNAALKSPPLRSGPSYLPLIVGPVTLATPFDVPAG